MLSDLVWQCIYRMWSLLIAPNALLADVLASYVCINFREVQLVQPRNPGRLDFRNHIDRVIT